ncbi:MAG: hypothetical protein KAQ69_07840 [Spirochaetales bacterium]|nr:hypothetical protein [Spirochaetales bacterium]
MKKFPLLILIILAAALLTSCFPDIPIEEQENQAGFFLGIWHGWIAPVSLVVSLFNKDITIFESHNTGFWYGLGFYVAIIGGFGGISLFRRKKTRKHKDDE